MYLSSDSPKSRPPPPPPPPAIDFYKDLHAHDVPDPDRDMIIEVVTSSGDLHHPQLVIAAPGDSGSGGDDPDSHTPAAAAAACLRSSSSSALALAPKKRAETWVQDETRSLICLRRDMDSLFNTSKSNKHLWEQISLKMRDKGFDRSPTMCTDKWRNLLKEFKKAKQHNNAVSNGPGTGGAAKMSYYKEIEEILSERVRSAAAYKSPNNTLPAPSPTALPSVKVDSFLQFSDKGIEDTSIPYGPIEGMWFRLA